MLESLIASFIEKTHGDEILSLQRSHSWQRGSDLQSNPSPGQQPRTQLLMLGWPLWQKSHWCWRFLKSSQVPGTVPCTWDMRQWYWCCLLSLWMDKSSMYFRPFSSRMALALKEACFLLCGVSIRLPTTLQLTSPTVSNPRERRVCHTQTDQAES